MINGRCLLFLFQIASVAAVPKTTPEPSVDPKPIEIVAAQAVK